MGMLLGQQLAYEFQRFLILAALLQQPGKSVSSALHARLQRQRLPIGRLGFGSRARSSAGFSVDEVSPGLIGTRRQFVARQSNRTRELLLRQKAFGLVQR